MGTGMLFGEMSILDWEPRSMSVTALLPTTVGIIHQTDFYQGCEGPSDTMKDIVKVLSSRLRNQNATLISQLRFRHQELEKLVDEKTQDLQVKNRELRELLQQLTSHRNVWWHRKNWPHFGHLTAGIAHEIQNPWTSSTIFLNSVWNWSWELSDEKEKKNVDIIEQPGEYSQ